MNKNNISPRNNQDFYKDNLSIVYALGGSVPATFVPERLSEFTPLRINILKYMFRLFNFRQVTCYAQETIARKMGCSRKAINEAFMFFKEMKIIDFVSGKKKWTMNKYSLGEFLWNPYVRWSLRFVFTNLTRAYFRMKEILNSVVENSVVESAVVEPEVTQLTNVNVLKELNTSVCSYRKRKDCENRCFKENKACLKQHKEDRLYQDAYLDKESWLNKQKKEWADWSLTKKNCTKDIVTLKEYEKFYENSEFSEKEIQRKIIQQAKNQKWNNRRYKNDITCYQSYLDVDGKDHKKVFTKPQEPQLKSEAYQIFTAIKFVDEDVLTARQRIEEAKKKSPNNFFLNRYAKPGTI